MTAGEPRLLPLPATIRFLPNLCLLGALCLLCAADGIGIMDKVCLCDRPIDGASRSGGGPIHGRPGCSVTPSNKGITQIANPLVAEGPADRAQRPLDLSAEQGGQERRWCNQHASTALHKWSKCGWRRTLARRSKKCRDLPQRLSGERASERVLLGPSSLLSIFHEEQEIPRRPPARTPALSLRRRWRAE